MSANTWNFPCWQCMDGYPLLTPRGGHGSVFTLGPGAVGGTTTLPFSTTFTGIFSVLIRSGFTDQSGLFQGIFSLGSRANANSAHRIGLNNSSTTPQISLFFYNESSGLTPYDLLLGDEDGTNWLQDDKWYQIGYSANSTAISYAVNGVTTPKMTTIANTPSALALNNGTPRIWTTGPGANANWAQPISVTTEYPSVVLGPAMWISTSMDFNDSTVRDRIWDSNGDFKNPGEDGSLWLGETYSETTPDFYCVTGTPHIQNGSDTQDWIPEAGGSSTMQGNLGGLRKQYE